jgi:hypothetical protein
MVEARTGIVAVLTWLLVACAEPRDPDDGLVASWPFDEGVGNVVSDESGNGNTGSIEGGAWGEGRHGSALVMDGGNDGIVRVPLSESLRRTSDEITVAAWTYRTAVHNVAVVAHDYPALFFGFHGPRFKWQIQLTYGKQCACYADLVHEAVPDRWIHIAATYDGWFARLYADGVEICRDFAWGSLAMPDGPLTLAAYLDKQGAIVDEITGRVDDVRIYDRALSSDEIRALVAR